MRRSEFDRAVDAEFGVLGSALIDDLGLPRLGNRTARQALRDGEPPRDVWIALCIEADVPEARRYGVGRLDPRDR
ncbi:DUF3046 domain-containing protein [Microbacterium thalli]|uniref:DUF3046 domain-containing protein n=1 Tax=Microbacterium thalli TaxID=3027921 RepID=A0ABT5SHM9_9MICO|nr:DUF3046 domain-containing protein [Microbacterium thalli]MDD7930311.1 DUF3046 domain-containing protein [Microbacterium thalli]MDD7962305.1 DUF3046 domain-containing protein [Microbacterium thalli]MDN8548387.1 DUF3046 domain-containing protein [Microbacterium thalli]